MKRLLSFFFVCFATISAHSLDREAFTFTKYDLNVRIEPEQQRLGVRGTITLRNDSPSPQRSLSLQISSSLHWSSIQFKNAPVEYLTQPYTSDIDHTGELSEAIVVLPQPVPPKQSIELEIGYEGIIQQDATRLTRIGVPEETAKHTDWDQIGQSFTAVRGIGYVAWYPIATESASMSDPGSLVAAIGRWKARETAAEMNVVLTMYSNGQSKVLCNGPATPISYEATGTVSIGKMQCKFGLLDQVVPLLVVGNFDLLDRPAVNILYLPEHKSGAGDYGSAIDEAAPLVIKWFGDHREGTEPKAETVDLPDANAEPYESRNMLLMPLSGSDTKLLLSGVQQLTHVYFHSSRKWIYKGLATYAQARFIEEKESHQAAIAYMEAHRNVMIDAEKQQAAAPHNPDSTALINATDESSIQTKAMYVWWMLRDMAGETAFDAALHNYKAAEDNSPTYMQKLLESAAHRDLQWFFDDWVYHDRALPDFRIDSVYASKLATGGYMVTVTVENLGGAAAETPITLLLKTGDASGRLMVAAKSKASLRIETPSLPQEAIVNDGSVPERDTSNNEYKLNH